MLFPKRPRGHDHDEADHDEHGGLHRDLDATMDRRGIFRLAARFGVLTATLTVAV